MLKKYKVDNVNGEGWALIVLDLETGFFSTASDHGNYVYVWSQPGKEFRAFLLGMRPDYLFEKLMFGRSDKRVYDPKASIASIREAVAKLEEAGWHFVQVPEVQCTQFCNIIFPRFQKLLKAELEAEKKDHEIAEEIRKNKPAIIAAVKSELETQFPGLKGQKT